MYNYNDIYYPDYLMHYGVKGMKWGHRRSQAVVDARAAYKSAKKDYNKSYNKAYEQSIAAYSPLKKHRQANDQRWNDVFDKADKLNKAKSDYKQAKKDNKAANKAADAAQDSKIMNARQKQSDSIAGLKKEAKNFALATVSGDKKAKVSATRNASKLVDSYISNKEVANRATSGERKVATAMAVIGGATVVAAAAKQAQVGRQMANMIYPGLYNTSRW